MRCPVCDSNDWENVDEHRLIKKGMSICKTCSFVSYPELYKTEEEIKAYYRTDYRNIPKAGNVFTGLRKIANHDAFLGTTLKEMAKTNPKPVIGEIGSATGMFLNHLKLNYFPEGDFNGTELTTTYRRVAFYDAGMVLTEDLDLTKKYDLLISYKVAEHQMDVDKKLREYVEAMSPEGLFYISVPTWFGMMNNFGLPGFELEYYYDTNHINVWTRQHFEYILKKVGLEIVKFDDLLYDETYLCKRNDALMGTQDLSTLPKPEEIKHRMAQIKKAFTLMQSGDPFTAVKEYPCYPEAWLVAYERRRQELHEHKQEVSLQEILAEFYEPFKAACGERYDTWRFAADVCMRYDDYEQALQFWQKCINIRPGAGYILGPVTHCYRRLAEMAKDPKAQEALRRKAMEITRHWMSADPEHRVEAMNWLYFDMAKMKLPSEGVGNGGVHP